MEFEKGYKWSFPDEYCSVVYDFFEAIKDYWEHIEDDGWTYVEIDRDKLKKAFPKLVMKYCDDPEAVYIISKLRCIVEEEEDRSSLFIM